MITEADDNHETGLTPECDQDVDTQIVSQAFPSHRLDLRWQRMPID
jgi:hypothetical protein